MQGGRHHNRRQWTDTYPLPDATAGGYPAQRRNGGGEAGVSASSCIDETRVPGPAPAISDSHLDCFELCAFSVTRAGTGAR
eukprot:scaffold79777_cov20-Tisochrysis_lutea.AAC.2